MTSSSTPSQYTISRRTMVSGAALAVVGAVTLQALPASAQDIQTRLIVLHAGTDVGNVELHINGAGVLDDFSYGSVSDWIDLDPGTARITITQDRIGFNYVIFDAVYPVPVGNDYYAIISDALMIGGAFDVASLPGDGARVQVTHASVDTPPITIVVSGQNVDLGTDLGYAMTSSSAPLPAGTYDLDVTLSESGESVLTVAGATFEAGKSYQLVLIGTPGDDDQALALAVLETDLIGSGDEEATPVS